MTSTTGSSATRADRARELLRTTAAERVDLVFALVLAGLAVFGFRSTFSGNEELTVGLPAVVLGVAVGFVLGKVRAPLLVSVATGVVVFFVFAGPIALHHRALAGLLPSPAAFSAAAEATITGWKNLLTTLPPAGEAGDLLTIPYLCGLASALAATALAVRYPRRSWCILPLILLLAVSVLMGTKRPASLLLQGVIFGGGLLAWMSVRYRRGRELHETSLSRRRLARAVALLTLAAAFGGIIGPRLPGADANDRYVWRDDVEPPFDPLKEPSALAGFRTYTDEDVRDDEILTVDGLPPGERVRIAMMDDYDGLVWRGSGTGTVLAGEYLRVGAQFPVDLDTDSVDMSFQIHKPQGVWLPLAGDVGSIEFVGDDRVELAEEVRVSIDTDTAALPSNVPPEVSYSIRTRFPEIPDPEELEDRALDGRFARVDGDNELPEQVISLASEWAGNAPTEHSEMEAIAEQLRMEGRYTDGGPDAQPISPPGHSLARMVYFLEPANPFGNGEQFASALALMAKARGIPARLVLGFTNRTDDTSITFKGSDIEAWVEVPVDGIGWVPVDGTPPEDQVPEVVARPRSVRENPEPQPPPPITTPPPTAVPEELEAQEDEEEEDDGEGSGLLGLILRLATVVGIPLLLLGGPVLLILLLKRRRRKRRRNQGTPSERLSGSFDELVDYARDLAQPVPPRSTRSERAAVLASTDGRSLAHRADEAVFGPTDPNEQQIDEAWSDSERGRLAMREGLSRADRLRAAVSVTSLRSN